MYTDISKCNAKSCICCNHLICQSTIISSVNHRQFSVVNNSDLDWKSEDVIYVLTCSEGGWGMQYVGQTKRPLNTRFKEHLFKIKTAKKIDTFLYKHFRRAGHSWSSSKFLVQPVEKIIHKSNSTERLKNILRHELKLKWMKRLQTPFPLRFNDKIYHEGNISKMPEFNFFFFFFFFFPIRYYKT